MMDGEGEEKVVQFKPPTDDTYLKWGLVYPRNPRFHYLYPSPTVSTLTNIANAMAAYPKLYVQVLHLMNKMNLPAPFGPTTPTPPTPSDILQESSSESEIESDSDVHKKNAKKTKRQKEVLKQRPKKRMKLIEDFPNLSGVAVEPHKVFELDEQATIQRQIQLKIPTAIPQRGDSIKEPNKNVQSIDTSAKAQTQSGFGVIPPVIKPVSSESASEDTDCKEFISDKILRRGRLSQKERKEINVFKKYVKGDLSCRLYLKNLAKQTTENDLRYIFGRYIDWKTESQVNAFDIRVMKEGRMKGQAFVTLPSEEAAITALDDTHAFVLNDKPMVVQFARSAKASADPNTEDK